MYIFFARRIHEHKMKLSDLKEAYRDGVKAAYKKIYGVDIPED